MFEFAQETERLKNDLSFCSMADNGSFGLEFSIISDEVDDRTQRLLESGIRLCKILQQDPKELEQSTTLPDRNQLISYDANVFLKSLVEDSDISLPSDLSKKAKEYEEILENIIAGKIYPEAKKREIQKFFDSIEIPYLHKAKERVSEFGSYRKHKFE